MEWLTNCDDRHLAALYGEVDALIAASEAEGFCLPLVEAAAIGCPILAADTPEGRKMSLSGTVLFPLRPGARAEVNSKLDAAALTQWRERTVPGPWRSWEEMTEQVLAALSG